MSFAVPTPEECRGILPDLIFIFLQNEIKLL